MEIVMFVTVEITFGFLSIVTDFTVKPICAVMDILMSFEIAFTREGPRTLLTLIRLQTMCLFI